MLTILKKLFYRARHPCNADEKRAESFGLQPRPLCAFCLTEFAPSQMQVDQHQCLLLGHVRAKWPELPPYLKRRMEEARNADDAAQAELTRGRRWWQFWK